MAETEPNMSDAALQNSSGALAEIVPTASMQPLIQRLTTSSGVIDTQRIHRHQAATANLADRLLQRLAMPEQQQTRYKIGVLQPGAIAQSLQRFQRREVMPAIMSNDLAAGHLAPFRNNHSVSVESAFPVPSPLWVESAPSAPQIARQVELSPASERLDAMTSQEPAGVFRIRRRALPKVETMPITIAAPVVDRSPTALPESISNDQVAIDSVSQMPVSSTHQTMHLAPLPVRSSSGDTSSSPAKIQRHEASSTAVPFQPALDLPVLANWSPSTVQRQAESSSSLNRTSVIESGLLPFEVVQRTNDLSQLADLPLPPMVSPAVVKGTVSSRTVQRHFEHPGKPEVVHQTNDLSQLADLPLPPMASPAVVKGTVSSPTVQRHFEHPGKPSQSSYRVTDIVQRSPQSIQAASHQSLKSVEPLPIVIQQQSLTLAGESVSRQPSSLPLAIQPTVLPNTIHRQEADLPGSTSVESSSGNSNAPATPPPAGTPLDAAELAEQVSRVLSRQLAVERERRGLG